MRLWKRAGIQGCTPQRACDGDLLEQIAACREQQVTHSGWTAPLPRPSLPAAQLPPARQAAPQLRLLLAGHLPQTLLLVVRALLQEQALPLRVLLLAQRPMRHRQLAGVPARGVPPCLRPPAAQRSPFPASESPVPQPGRPAGPLPPHCTPGNAGTGEAEPALLVCGMAGCGGGSGHFMRCLHSQAGMPLASPDTPAPPFPGSAC